MKISIAVSGSDCPSFNCAVCSSADGHARFPIDIHFAEDVAQLKLVDPPPGIWRCAACGHHSVHPLPDDNFVRAFYARYMNVAVKGFYSLRTQDTVPQEFRERYLPLIKLTKNNAAANNMLRLLDIGAGAGMFLRLAREEGYEVEGLEPNQEAAQRLRETFGIPVHEALLEDFAASCKYDLVTMWDLLEHLRDPRSAVEKISMILKPDGQLLVEIPVRDSLLSRAAVAIYWLSAGLVTRPLFLIFGVHHFHYFSRAGIIRLFGECGMKIVEMRQAETPWSSLRKKAGHGVLRNLKAICFNSALFFLILLARFFGSKNKLVVLAKKMN